MTTFYKKLVSLDPDRYIKITHLEALEGYKTYIGYFIEAYKKVTNCGVPKTFHEWLLTEI